MGSRGEVTFAVVGTGEGAALVAARGGRVVASFLPGPSRKDQVRRLRERFPGAVEAPETAVPGAAAMRRWVEGDPAGLASIPVEIPADPPFHGRVWRALRKVPPGRTVTYGELARRAGSPGGGRAVGRAMAGNPLAPFVPCHRVVGHGGALGGYSGGGGVDRKARALREERDWAEAR
jgi:methylated-DNA-[protein]-cysteine S-methyltransferase